MSRLCLCEKNCRGGTEVSVKITCDVEEKIMYGKGAYVGMLEIRFTSKDENKREEKRKRKRKRRVEE